MIGYCSKPKAETGDEPNFQPQEAFDLLVVPYRSKSPSAHNDHHPPDRKTHPCGPSPHASMAQQIHSRPVPPCPDSSVTVTACARAYALIAMRGKTCPGQPNLRGFHPGRCRVPRIAFSRTAGEKGFRVTSCVTSGPYIPRSRLFQG